MQRTKENWTYGIVNIPLLFGDNNRLGVNPRTICRKVAHNAKCYKKPYYALDKSKRYLWFEQDTTNREFHLKVLAFYKGLGIDVFWHETMKGFHYVTLALISRAEHEFLVNRLKVEFNNGSFYYSLRIVPNKWVDENKVWYHGYVVDNGSGHFNKLQYVKSAMNQPYQHVWNQLPKTAQMLDNMFPVSLYKFSE